MNEPKQPDAIASHNRQADDYDLQADEYNWRGPEVAFGLSYECLRPGETLLDVGIGTGLSARLFKQAGLNIYGLDGSPDMIKMAAAKNLAEELKLHDLADIPWPFPAHTFHHASAIGVFHFFREPTPLLAECMRLVKSGGMLAFTYSLPRTEHGDTDDIVAEIMEGEGVTIYHHRPEYVRTCMYDTGWTVHRELEFLAMIHPGTGAKWFGEAVVALK
jgi:ubiquinone/menaquinone biosynthesis C-methylase UbiE